MAHRILMVVTSADQLPSGHRTGVWLEEFAVPYLEFTGENIDVTVASPKGGAAPVDPMSEEDVDEDAWPEARAALGDTRSVAEVEASDFDVIFFPGGHGPLADLPADKTVQRLVRGVWDHGGIVAAMCHGPAALLNVKLGDYQYLVEHRKVTAFTNAEEREVGLEQEVPFLLQDELEERNARFVDGGKWADHVETDGRLITGQNPQSSRSTARTVIEELREADRAETEARP